ncbi:MAG: NAD(P)/FAD-dependent oxidoreductase [Halanaerobium sp.]|nr:NAD(P)/FAD-dependent oxidoreductase [Halanaerobium sp.]
MESNEHRDVIIVGAGPAGIFTALRLCQEGPGLKITLIEKGNDLKKRFCPAKERSIDCIHCNNCSIVCGWGGAGAFSDGKLTLSPDIGGHLGEYIGRDKLQEMIKEVDDIYLSYGAPEKIYGVDQERAEEIRRKATLADLKFIPAKLRHLGTGYSQKVLQEMKDALLANGVDIHIGEKVEQIIVEGDQVRGVKTCADTVYMADYVVVAPGRENAEWLSQEAERLKINMTVNPVDIGVRVEVPAPVLENLTRSIYESKLIFHSKTFEDKVRTFCMCPNGEVVNENNQGLITVNGHSHAHKKTSNSNFALLVSKTFTEPFKEPITYGKYIARLANLLGGGVLVQRLGDLLNGRRSTPERIKRGIVEPSLADATPGDLSLVFPYRHLMAITEMLEALDQLAPGLYSRNTLLYGVEVKFYSSRLQVDRNLKTRIRNLYVGGDGAGITRGLMQASVSGVLIGNSILQQMEG